MVFNCVKGHPDARVAIGVLASRKGLASFWGAPGEFGKTPVRERVGTGCPSDGKGACSVSGGCA